MRSPTVRTSEIAASYRCEGKPALHGVNGAIGSATPHRPEGFPALALSVTLERLHDERATYVAGYDRG